MTTLQGFPMVSQLTSVTSDNQPSENKFSDCVPTSVCAGAMYLNGIHTLGGAYTPDQWKDKGVGQGYVGGTAISAYVAYAASLGIKLWRYGSTSTAELVAEAHRQIQAGHPVVFNPSPTHVCVFFSEDSTAHTLTCMDPWIAQAVTKTDAEWESLLRYNQIWPMERTDMTPTGWKDDGTRLTAPNGIAVVQGFRTYILSHAWASENWPLEPEQSVLLVETSNPNLGAGTRQTFRMTVLEWTPARGVFAGWVGVELLKLREELAAKGS